MDLGLFFANLHTMLDGIRIFSSDSVWRHILLSLGATVLDTPNVLDVNLDKIPLPASVSPEELRSLIVRYADNTKILKSVFGEKLPQLSVIQQGIVVALHRSGGMTGTELNTTLEHLPASVHTIENAIYDLRKLYGHNFITLKDGVYQIGSL